MLSKARALELLDIHLETDNLKKHCIASGAIMKALGNHFNKPADEWEVIGLLHDLDFDKTRDDPERHALETLEMLKDEDISQEYLQAIGSHNEANGMVRSSLLDHALVSAESITGLIIACALVYPDKKISSVKPKSIKKRMKATAFAKAVSRENIRECEKAGINLDDFIAISLSAMSEIEDELIGN